MRRAGLGLAAIAAVVALVACQKVSPVVTASVSPCFRALPQAHAALDGQGKFVDVARIRGGAVTRFPRLPTTTLLPEESPAAPATSLLPGTSPGAPTTLAPGRRDVCLVAYSGPFDPSRIQHLVHQAGTQYAIVVVGVTSREVRGVVLTDTLPKPLHAH
jgi:hypothetical protein